MELGAKVEDLEVMLIFLPDDIHAENLAYLIREIEDRELEDKQRILCLQKVRDPARAEVFEGGFDPTELDYLKQYFFTSAGELRDMARRDTRVNYLL